MNFQRRFHLPNIWDSLDILFIIFKIEEKLEGLLQIYVLAPEY